ncbi:hypothetical protein QUF54_10915 [Candidatus Marithioploca araucensis]|uniref:Uncharacterized protein n=1 Tax=Candidatus Marithioploca araucensis TaxID=70273 RepID=A0ABT7VW85_9GAMM|nr:hypothetical protein [Candidatus Marithioploca araucensis]
MVGKKRTLPTLQKLLYFNVLVGNKKTVAHPTKTTWLMFAPTLIAIVGAYLRVCPSFKIR